MQLSFFFNTYNVALLDLQNRGYNLVRQLVWSQQNQRTNMYGNTHCGCVSSLSTASRTLLNIHAYLLFLAVIDTIPPPISCNTPGFLFPLTYTSVAIAHCKNATQTAIKTIMFIRSLNVMLYVYFHVLELNYYRIWKMCDICMPLSYVTLPYIIHSYISIISIIYIYILLKLLLIN